jgi:hypothetical protein
MKETTNMNRQMFIEWFPQIMYNHHQTGPAGAVMFAPPFRDPFNYNFDPLSMMELNLVGAAMHSRFAAEAKPGVTMRSGATYSTWYNGGLRTTTYFHNIIGLLTETIGHPTPIDVPLVAQRQLATGDLPMPVAPQKWHFRQSIEYSLTANLAVLDLASRYREQLLFNIYRMGKNSIERGSRDSWTITPKRIEALRQAASKEKAPDSTPAPDGPGGAQAPALPAKLYDTVLRDPAMRDPRAYILPADQPDFPTATKFINTLLKNGISVHRATARFQSGGITYPAGSWVVKTAQAFRPHVLDMFEPQDHPNDFQYPGGPPIPPYDVTGYTLAYQMGVQFVRVLDSLDGPFEKVTEPLARVAGRLEGPAHPAGYLISHEMNDAFIVVNRLLKSGDAVFWQKQPVQVNGRTLGPGTMWIPDRAGVRALLDKATRELGLTAWGVPERPAGDSLEIRPVRIALWDQYGGSMPSGWTRWILEQFEFPFEVVYPADLDAGNLAARFDVLLLPDGALPRAEPPQRPTPRVVQPKPEDIPEEYRKRLGYVTPETTVPQLKRFAESGGTIITIGASTRLAEFFGLPIKSALVERSAQGIERPLPREKFYIPGSVLRVSVDQSRPAAYGLGKEVDVFFENSPAFRLPPDAAARGVQPVAWFADAAPLRSGWAWGQAYLEGAVAAAEANVGEGKVYLLGIEAVFRGQPHGTFKLLFNSIYAGKAR